jgi:hypothetical protein
MAGQGKEEQTWFGICDEWLLDTNSLKENSDDVLDGVSERLGLTDVFYGEMDGEYSDSDGNKVAVVWQVAVSALSVDEVDLGNITLLHNSQFGMLKVGIPLTKNNKEDEMVARLIETYGDPICKQRVELDGFYFDEFVWGPKSDIDEAKCSSQFSNYIRPPNDA